MISFNDFMDICNFRNTNKYGQTDSEKEDSKIIRVYFQNNCWSDWFEFGVYDFGGDNRHIAKAALSEKILNSNVEEISFDPTTGVFKVFLDVELNQS